MGAVDLIKKLTGTTALERIEKKRKLIEAKGIRMPEPEPENIEEMVTYRSYFSPAISEEIYGFCEG
uniref:Uncharacterized protein n=1 Tax=Parascaris equorum TaxID=6256 RepID=A0A914S7F3_PAREQ